MNHPPVWDPADGCRPFARPFEAEAVRRLMRTPFLAAIAVKFRNPVALYLWMLYIDGGSGLQTYGPGGDVAASFTNSSTTAMVNGALLDQVVRALTATPPTFAPGANTANVALASVVDPSWIDDPRGGMDFSAPTELPGNIAGGIGKDQLTQQIGSRPSPQNDSREVTGGVTVTRQSDGSMTVASQFEFRAADTIDLCPGNLGANLEQNLTIPLSRLEASGVAGDVPFEVHFGGPAHTRTIPAPASIPEPTASSQGTVTASRLNIRRGPGRSHAVVGYYSSGERVRILEQVAGENIGGHDAWNRTDRGWVSDRYVRH